MKPTIENLKDSFKFGYESFEESRNEALQVLDLYHNRQYDDATLNVLANRGQPVENFNIIKMFARMLLGYYSTIVNRVKVSPTKQDSILVAEVLQDAIDYTFRTNDFSAEGDKLKADEILTGLMCSYVNVEKTGEKDQFGRPKYKINISHIPSLEVVLDPMSRLDDYSDARFIHRFKWVAEEEAKDMFGAEKIKELEAYDNHLEIDEADFSYTYNNQFQGKYKRFDNYLIVHSIVKDKDRSWSVYWSAETILSKKEITYKKVKNPYRIQKLHTSNRTEFYGLFREVIGTQHAINQAIIKIQLMVNTQKAFVEDGAVEDIADFTDNFNRVNAVIPVRDLQGIKVESLTREVLDQYAVIDRALDRVQRVLGINDSFLGMAYASDSGAKVKIQQGAANIAQKYATSKIENFYRLLGWDVLNLVKQYYTATDVIRVADNYNGSRWVQMNKPLEIPTGEVNPQTGEQLTRNVYEEVTDPASGEPLKDEYDNIIMAPIPTRDTDIAFSDTEIELDTQSYDDDNEQNRLMFEQVINGQIGGMLMQMNPAGYLKVGALSIKDTKSKYSLEISSILEETISSLQQQNPEQQGNMLDQLQIQQGGE